MGIAMNVKYDFHIHTALSSCALEEMSPNNIVNMAIISELDAIAITDHNSCQNVEAVMTVAKELDLVVIPGMEVETREEIHVVCLFETVQACNKMQAYVYASLPKRKNKPSVLGRQLIFDVQDNIIAEEEKLLSFATTIPLEDLIQQTINLGGVAIPAHIDRPSYSVVSNLGFIPPNLPVQCLEISQYAEYNTYKDKYKKHTLLQSSDAHELGFIGICMQELQIPKVSKSQLNVKVVLDFLKKIDKS